MLLELDRRCNAIFLAGNHEVMLLQAKSDRKTLSEWMMHGGTATLESYQRRSDARAFEVIPERHWEFLTEKILAYWETSQHIFIHGALDPESDLAEQPDVTLLWERFSDPMVHKSGKEIICGHTSQQSGLPALFEGGICIDTWVYGNGWLTGLDLAQQTFFQANEQGERRTFDLPWLQHYHRKI
jgi:serine/threonine protein phosphatase 1